MSDLPKMNSVDRRIVSKILENNEEFSGLRSMIKNSAKTKQSIILGPWLSEVGFELLYWVPFLNWLVEKHNLDPNQCIAVSRGGCGSWYQAAADRYFDILSVYSADEFREHNEKRVEERGGRKHLEYGDFDRAIIEKVAAHFELNEYEVIHPKEMYSLFRLYWNSMVGYDYVAYRTDMKLIQNSGGNILEQLGLERGEYVAVKFYNSSPFQGGAKIKAYVESLLNQIAKTSKVVILDMPVSLDEHDNYSIDLENVINLGAHLKPADNLNVQTEVVGGAKAFYGTYGGFSYLACLQGVDSYAYYTHIDRIALVHLDMALRTFKESPFGRFMPINLSALPELD